MKTYRSVREVSGPLIVVEGVGDAGYDEVVEVQLPSGETRRGKVLETAADRAVVQIFEGTDGVGTDGVAVKFTGRPVELGVGEGLLGRIFDGSGRPVDGAPAPIAEASLPINGAPLNPFSRDMPSEYIETGISSIDVLNTLVRGQKLPVFSGAGLPHAELAAQIARQARAIEADGSEADFAIVFGAMGVTHEEAKFFENSFRESGALGRSVLFVNTADQPAPERIAVPRMALTAAEFLAFEKGKHVLVILTDMLSYCEALREISAAKKELPGRRGFPGYMYTDLAGLYERAGKVRGRAGTVTQVPILSMPEDDKTHPVPDLTGYITEGQFYLDRDYDKKNLTPPIDAVGSLSRLKGQVQGKKTRKDHPKVADQLSMAYSRGKNLRELAAILGEDSLSPEDRNYLDFAGAFEKQFIDQKSDPDRTLDRSLEIAWALLRTLPRKDLIRIPEEMLAKFYDGDGEK